MKKILIPVRHETMTPDTFLESIKTDRLNIDRVMFIPPTIGDGTFGKIDVYYKFAKLKPSHVG